MELESRAFNRKVAVGHKLNVVIEAHMQRFQNCSFLALFMSDVSFHTYKTKQIS